MNGNTIPVPGLRYDWAQLGGETIATHAELAVFLGGSTDSFTGLLLDLFAKADAGNTSRLAGAFPLQMAIWRIWRCLEPAPTFSQLQAIRDILES